MARSNYPASSIKKIRDSWFRESPKRKLGVTERYVVFGETRKWMIDQIRDRLKGPVLDLGSGHGFLSYQIAAETEAEVVGIDFLGGDQLQSAKNGARIGNLRDRISWVVGDARNLPFEEGSFDALVSFLALQDVAMTSGATALSGILRNCRAVVRQGGILALADNMFPECAQSEGQSLYSKIQSREFQCRLPSKNRLIGTLRTMGVHNLEEKFHDPRIELSAKESKIELKDIVGSKPFGRNFDFTNLWRKYGNQINSSGLSYPRVLLITGRS
jgi:ubiquinone/menaquinone biosynthesis C-methylase UbiE